jgi:type IV secretion system protein VirB5
MLKTFIKQTVLAVAVAAAVLALPTAYAGGIPVIDGATLAQDIMNHIENIAKLVQQIEHMKEQIQNQEKQVQQLQETYESTTGKRGLGQILADPKFKDYLPDEWGDVVSNLQGLSDGQGNGEFGLAGKSAALRNAMKRFDTCQFVTDAGEKLVCERRASEGVQQAALGADAFEKAKQRLSQIEALMRQIDETEDPKAIQEIIARIGAEQAAIQNEQTKLSLFRMIADSQEKMAEQQDIEYTSKRFIRSQAERDAKKLTGVPYKPIDW